MSQLRQEFAAEKARLQQVFEQELQAHRCRLNEEKAQEVAAFKASFGGVVDAPPAYPHRRLRPRPRPERQGQLGQSPGKEDAASLIVDVLGPDYKRSGAYEDHLWIRPASTESARVHFYGPPGGSLRGAYVASRRFQVGQPHVKGRLLL
jgi:hypothetical protein